MKNSKLMRNIIAILIILIIVGLIGIMVIAINNKLKDDNEMDSLTEVNVVDIKKYIEDNYDNYNIDGSTSMIPLHESLNSLFSSEEREVKHSKTVEAFEKFINGENDILFGVDYSDELLERVRNSGIELVKVPITREGFVFLINKNNPVKSLTIEQIRDIYSGKVTNWKEVGGDDAPIDAYQRNTDSGSQIRMNKFMGDTKLIESDVKYTVLGMGDIVEVISDFDKGKYSIAYNMYTFIEKQYINSEVMLLNIDGIYPNDDSIFDETYPIIIYNYIYYDKNNDSVSEFVNNLYMYLMSDEGQKLISDSGYVNLNKKYDRNKNIYASIDGSTNDRLSGELYGEPLTRYNQETGEIYAVDDNGNLITFNNYADYVLDGTKYKNNVKVREFLTLVFDLELLSGSAGVDTVRFYDSTLEEATMTTVKEIFGDSESVLILYPWHIGGGWSGYEPYNYKYNNKYYMSLFYNIDEDKYVLSTMDEEMFNGNYGDWFKYIEFKNNVVPNSILEITKEELKDLYLRTLDIDPYGDPTYFQPFK